VFSVFENLYVHVTICNIGQKMKQYLTWKEKVGILQEVKKAGSSIKGVAKKNKIYPCQIRRWKKKYVEFFENPNVTPSKKKNALGLKALQTGRAPMDEDVYADLKLFYEELRGQDRLVSVNMLCYELKRLKPSLEGVSMEALRNRVGRWRARENIAHRKFTHVAQNTRFNEIVINDFVVYVNEQISIGGYNGDGIVNIDETNIFFDSVGNVTLENKGTRTINYTDGPYSFLDDPFDTYHI